jgi:hypothetical protein
MAGHPGDCRPAREVIFQIERFCVNADWPSAYLRVSVRAVELRRRAGVYRPVRASYVASVDDSLTMIMLRVGLDDGE